ncbi:hypothetical protein XANCAGTX0491_007345 [Xanthoria calcicola]
MTSDHQTKWTVATIAAVLVLANLAVCIHRSSRLYLFQQSLCLQHYLSTDVNKIGPLWHVDEALCKVQQVQSPLSIIEGLDAFLQLLPALLMLATYQKLLPVLGLRRCLLINVALSACGILSSAFFYSLHQPWTSTAILLTFLFDLLGGGDLTRVNLCVTVIASLLPPGELTRTNNRISALWVLANVGGSALGSLLLSRHVLLLNGLGIACSLVALRVNAFLPHQLGQSSGVAESTDASAGDLLLQDDLEPQQASLSLPTGQHQGGDSIAHILLDSWRSSFYSVTTLFHVPHPTITVICIFLLYTFTVRVEVLNSQYLSLTFGWPLATVNLLLACNALFAAMTLFALPAIRKFYLDPRMDNQQADLSVVKASLLLNAIGMVGFGISIPSAPIIISLFAYTGGAGLWDSLTTFGLTSLAKDQRPSDFLVRCGLVQTIAGLVAAPFWSIVLSVCLNSHALPMGLPYWMSAALFGGTLILSRSLRGQGTDSPMH